MKRHGLSHSVRRGHWQLTDAGRQFHTEHPAPWSPALAQALIAADPNIRLRERASADMSPTDDPVGDQSPDDRLDSALGELRDRVAEQLLEELAKLSSTRFEFLVLDVLHRLGYGTSRRDIKRVGGSGDGGIDGVIALDRLGLEKVYVQAKCWQNQVGRPEIQGFYGALAGQRARKGVFITTSDFSQPARDFANQLKQLVLVDGRMLVDLMIDHEVGVTLKRVAVPKLDSDYFTGD